MRDYRELVSIFIANKKLMKIIIIIYNKDI